MDKIILETERLILREMTESDYGSLCKILMDDEVMYAYEGALSETEAKDWLLRQIERYKNDGFGLYAVVLKENNEMIGQCGITKQNWRNETLNEIGYLFQKEFWHKGYATESAKACKDYAFNVLGFDEVVSIIRDSNISSQNVAKRNGMTAIDESIRHYRGIDMPHYLFSVKK